MHEWRTNSPAGSGLRAAAPHAQDPFSLSLLADTELADQFAIALDVLRSQIIEQTTALAHQLEKPPARMMILRVNLEMLGQVRDALGQKRDLHFRRAGVAGMGGEFSDDFLLAGGCQTHVAFSSRFLVTF